MKQILMILTSHRLDCLRLCIDMLIEGGSAHRFERICLLCSGVTGRHKHYVESLPQRHPELNWDFIWGDRGRGKPISEMQNECVRRYPHQLYFKIDEDTFVSDDWDRCMRSAYDLFKDDPRLSLITPVVTNNQRGAYHLLTTFPDLGEEFTRRFRQPIVTDRMGPVWLYPQCAEFLIRRFLNLKQANTELRNTASNNPASEVQSITKNEKRKTKNDPSTFNLQPVTFSYPFSINCIAYDYRHWQEIGGVPEEDENGWGEWIPAHDKFIVLATDAIVHHYAFFVQQRWLDRSSLLEDIREANLPHSIKTSTAKMMQMIRILRDVPTALLLRLRPQT